MSDESRGIVATEVTEKCGQRFEEIGGYKQSVNTLRFKGKPAERTYVSFFNELQEG